MILKRRWSLMAVGLAAAFAAGFAVRGFVPGEPVAYAQAQPRVRAAHLHGARRQARRAAQALPRATGAEVLPAPGLANVSYREPMDAPLSQTTMADMIGIPEPRRGQEELGFVPGDQDWAQSGQGVRRRPGEDRVGVLRARGLFTSEVGGR